MANRNWYFAFRIITGVCAAYFCMLLAAGPFEGDRERQISCPEDLRAELRRAQITAPPRTGSSPVYTDAGDFLFISEDDADGNAFAEGLVPVVGADNVMRWPVTVFEDPLTHATVLLNADGDEVGRLGMPPDYDPAWVIDTLFPEGVPKEIDAADYDPARVVLYASLLSSLSSAPAAAGLHAQSDTRTGSGPPAEKNDRLHTSQDKESSSSDRAVPPRAAESSEARTNAPGQSVAQPVRRVQGRIVYVDRKRGNDTWAGRAGHVTADNNGPKRTVAAGVKALRDGDQLMIREGVYGETLDVRGKRSTVSIRGNVVLKGTKGGGGSDTSHESETTSATGTVAQAMALQKK